MGRLTMLLALVPLAAAGCDDESVGPPGDGLAVDAGAPVDAGRSTDSGAPLDLGADGVDASPEDDASVGSPTCPPAGPFGSSEGDIAPAVTLLSCEGEEVSLHELCDAPVGWVMEYAEWCPTCRTFARNDVEAIWQANRDRGLEAFVVISADGSFEAPDAQLCAEVRDRYGFTMPVLYDPTGAFQSGLDVASNSVNVLFTRGMRIAWKGRYQDDEVAGRIDALLAE